MPDRRLGRVKSSLYVEINVLYAGGRRGEGGREVQGEQGQLALSKGPE